MGLANVDGVFGSEQLVGSYELHVLFDHEVLNNAGGCKRKPVTTMHQHALPLFCGGVDAFIDVLEAAVFESQAFLDGIRQIAHVHFESRPAVLHPSRTSAGNKSQTSLPGKTAHVDDAVDVVTAQRASAVSRVQVSNINVVCDF